MAAKRKRDGALPPAAVAAPGRGVEDGLQHFRKSVQELKNKSQSRITALTSLADSQYGFAEEVSRILLDEIASAQVSRLQPLLSVVDSILKKVGKDYRTHLSERMPETVRAAYDRSDAGMHLWLLKMVQDSWRKHDLLPPHVLDRLEVIFVPAAAAAMLHHPGAAAAALAPTAAARHGVIVVDDGPEFLGAAAMAGFSAGMPAYGGMQHLLLHPQAPPPAQQLRPLEVPGLPTLAAAPAPLGGAWQQPQTAPPEGAQRVPETVLKAGPAPPMKAPPPQRSPPAPAAGEPARAPARRGSDPHATDDDPELVERRLSILTKIIERRSPGHEELSEIMKVPEIRRAIAMQQKGDRQKAMALLSQFKQELERKHNEYRKPGSAAAAAADAAAAAAPAAAAEAKPRDPRQPQDLKPADPRQLDSRVQEQKPADPRQADPRQPEPRPVDPRQVDKPADPRQRSPDGADRVPAQPARRPPAPDASAEAADQSAAGKRSADAEATASQQAKQQRVAPPAAGAAVASAEDAAVAGTAEASQEVLSDEEGQPRLNGQAKSMVPARQILQGLPSIGFSEAWMRQFLEQMPTKALPQDQRVEVPSVGRKVLGASGEQMVYVDELSHSEILLLMQFIFLLEERLRRSGGGMDLTQRIPHTFGYLQVEPAIDVMLKRFFGDLPFQCTSTGLRFASQEKLRLHHDALYRRRSVQQQRQRGAEARGWMESIPEWVGNRDLVVGPALFRLGEAGEESQRAQEAQQLRLQAAQAGGGPSDDEEDADADPGGVPRWLCPLDERRAVCPVSGEPFARTWSTALNDWAFSDAVASELGAAKPLRFPPGGPTGPHGLSETAVLFKKSCFFNTTPARRLEALLDCRRGTGAGAGSRRGAGEGGPSKAAPAPAKQDPELAALAGPRPAPRRFF